MWLRSVPHHEKTGGKDSMMRKERQIARRRRAQRRAAVLLAVAAVLAVVVVTLAAFAKQDSETKSLAARDEYITPVVCTIPEEAREKLDAPQSLFPEVSMTPEISEALEEPECVSEKIPLPGELQLHLAAACEEYSVPLEIALGCIETESSFQENAGTETCYGYMQINSINLAWLGDIGVTDLLDPCQNITAGVYMLGDLYERYGDWHLALTAYNFGEARAQKHVFSKGLTSTKYSRKVMTRAEVWAEVIAGD